MILERARGIFLVVVIANTFIFSLEKKRKRRRKEEGRGEKRGKRGEERRGLDMFRIVLL